VKGVCLSKELVICNSWPGFYLGKDFDIFPENVFSGFISYPSERLCSLFPERFETDFPFVVEIEKNHLRQ
jgi:hypothetical protein